MSKPRGLGFLSRFLLVIGLACSPLVGCYAEAYPDGVYVAHGGGYYGDGYHYRHRYYRNEGPRYYHRGPDHYYRGDRYYHGRHGHHYHARRYRDW